MDHLPYRPLAMSRRALIGGVGASLLSTGLHARGMANPVVETASGKLRGGMEANGTLVFRGIPYALVPARFRAPEPATPWAGIRDATLFGPSCPQPAATVAGSPEILALFGSTLPMPAVATDEACQVLNVWTSTLSGPKRPVLFWIHGGGFESGAGSQSTYWGDGLAATGEAVVVSINHRLSAFGHLYLAELGGAAYADSGMAGMLDIVAALRWVRDNIAAFGGDPGNVTIFGQSGGGAKVATLLAMPAAKGLFHRAICQSGTLVKGLSPEQATTVALAYLDELGIARDRLAAMETLPASHLVAALAKVGSLAAPRNRRLAPVVDGRNLPHSPFDPVAPLISRDVPLIIGCTTGEATIIGGLPSDFALTPEQFEGRIAAALSLTPQQAAALATAARADMPHASVPDLFFRIFSDSLFGQAAALCADRKTDQGGAPVYAYLFDWEALALDGKYRAFHGIEHPFVFRHLASATGLAAGPEARPLEEAISQAWLSFAHSGDPNHARMPRWEPYDAVTRPTMMFQTESHLAHNPFPHLRAAAQALPARFAL